MSKITSLSLSLFFILFFSLCFRISVFPGFSSSPVPDIPCSSISFNDIILNSPIAADSLILSLPCSFYFGAVILHAVSTFSIKNYFSSDFPFFIKFYKFTFDSPGLNLFVACVPISYLNKDYFIFLIKPYTSYSDKFFFHNVSFHVGVPNLITNSFSSTGWYNHLSQGVPIIFNSDHSSHSFYPIFVSSFFNKGDFPNVSYF